MKILFIEFLEIFFGNIFVVQQLQKVNGYVYVGKTTSTGLQINLVKALTNVFNFLKIILCVFRKHFHMQQFQKVWLKFQYYTDPDDLVLAPG